MSAVQQMLDRMGFVSGVGFPSQYLRNGVDPLEEYIDPRISETTSSADQETVIIQGFPYRRENGLVPAWDTETEHEHVVSEVSERELWLNQKLAEALGLIEEQREVIELGHEIITQPTLPSLFTFPSLPTIDWKPIAIIAAVAVGIWALFKR